MTDKGRGVLDLIKERRTVRQFNTTTIPNDVLLQLIDAARWAPCPNNLQPWKFIAAGTESIINSAVAAYLEKAAQRESIGVSIFVRDAVRILRSAPLAIYVLNTNVVARKYEQIGRRYTKCARLFENQAISAAIQNLVLCAEERGIGAVWLGSPVFVAKGIEKILRTKYELSAVIALGYYDKKPKSTQRLPVESVLTIVG